MGHVGVEIGVRAMPDLVERRVGFEYGYNMTCPDCPGITTLTSAEYYRECNDAHVKCAHCMGDIHFGPAVMTLRDADDPVLDDHTACTVAWYHTSTKPGWPGDVNPMPPSAVKILAGMIPPHAVRRARHRHETQALHLGTYETAVESMLRRMRDQDGGGEQFYLHRVALRDGLIIEQGWRDENSAEAAQITQPDLGDVDAIRYLNVHESPGSISLAVRREAIASVQRVPLPVYTVEVTATSPLLREVAHIRAQIDQIEATRPADLDTIERIQQGMARQRGVPFARTPTPAQSALLDRICQLIADEYLPCVSQPVRAKFADALRAWESAQLAPVDDGSYISRFGSMARTLTQPDEILRILNNQATGEL